MSLHHPQPIALPPTPLTAETIPIGIPGSEQRSKSSERAVRSSRVRATVLALRSRIAELYKDNIGLLLIAASQLFMTLMNITVKFLNDIDEPVPTLELVFVRMFITYCCCISYMIIRRIPHPVLGPPEVRSLLVFRGVSGFFGLFGMYYSLKYLSLSDAVVLSFLAPTTTAISGYVFLRESLSRKALFAGLLSLVGVILIAQPQSIFGSDLRESKSQDGLDIGLETGYIASTQRLIAVGVAMLGVAGATGAYVSLRAIGTRAHTMHSLTFFSSYSVLVSVAGMLALRVTPVIPKRWLWCGYLVAIGICGFIGQVLLVMGLQRETASRGALALYIQIIFASALDRLIFKITPSYLSLFGMFIIIGSGLYVALTKEKNLESYKRVPQADIEAHELQNAPQEYNADILELK